MVKVIFHLSQAPQCVRNHYPNTGLIMYCFILCSIMTNV